MTHDTCRRATVPVSPENSFLCGQARALEQGSVAVDGAAIPALHATKST
jgi:hypothetical protein